MLLDLNNLEGINFLYNDVDECLELMILLKDQRFRVESENENLLEILNLYKGVLIDDIDKELLVNSYIRNCVINEGLDEEL